MKLLEDDEESVRKTRWHLSAPQNTWKSCCCCCCCCCCRSSFCRRSSITFLWELECWFSTNVGLAAGLYSGTRRPDLCLTPHALQRVFGPSGPVLHCGVFSEAQCVHRRPTTTPASALVESLESSFGFPAWFNRLVWGSQVHVLSGRTAGVPAMEFVGMSEKESSTNRESHSNSSTSSLCTWTERTNISVSSYPHTVEMIDYSCSVIQIRKPIFHLITT